MQYHGIARLIGAVEGRACHFWLCFHRYMNLYAPHQMDRHFSILITKLSDLAVLVTTKLKYASFAFCEIPCGTMNTENHIYYLYKLTI